MRIFLDIDESVLAGINEIALRKKRSTDAVASDLLRLALASSARQKEHGPAATYGFVPFVAGPSVLPVSNEYVDRIREELGI